MFASISNIFLRLKQFYVLKTVKSSAGFEHVGVESKHADHLTTAAAHVGSLFALGYLVTLKIITLHSYSL